MHTPLATPLNEGWGLNHNNMRMLGFLLSSAIALNSYCQVVNSNTANLSFNGLDRAGGQVTISGLGKGKEISNFILTSEGSSRIRIEASFAGGLAGTINLYSHGSKVASFPAGPNMPEVIIEDLKVASLSNEEEIWPLFLMVAMYCTRISGDGNGVTSWEWDCCRCPGMIVSGGNGQYADVTRVDFVPSGGAGVVDQWSLKASGGASVRVQ